MAFQFKSGPPKAADTATVASLKRIVAAGDKIDGAKSIGDGTIKVFMQGPKNFYLTDSSSLRTFLQSNNVVL